MNIWTAILLIAVISVIIIDISGFIENLEAGLTRALGFKAHIPKPLSCSLCMAFWTGIFYSIFSGCFSIPVLAYVCFISVLTPVISDAIWTIRDFFGFVIAWINTWWKI